MSQSEEKKGIFDKIWDYFFGKSEKAAAERKEALNKLADGEDADLEAASGRKLAGALAQDASRASEVALNVTIAAGTLGVGSGSTAVVSSSKAISLPGWSKVSVDMGHIAERHMTGGALTAGRDVFVGLSQRGVMAAVRQAYGSARTVTVQGERLLLSGTTKTGMNVEMWFNRTTRVIETAYPVVR